jgi:hypothetical protein
MECVGLNQSKHSTDRVMRWDTIVELDEFPEPRQSDLPKQFDVLPAFGTAKHSENREDENIQKTVGLRMVDSRIFNHRQLFNQAQLCNHSVDSRKRGNQFLQSFGASIFFGNPSANSILLL